MELKLRAKLLDIETGQVLVALLEEDVAKQLDVFPADRLRVTVPERDCSKHGKGASRCSCKSVICVVDKVV